MYFTSLDRCSATQQVLKTIVVDMATYPARYDETEQKIAASSAVKSTLSIVTEHLPADLQETVQTILDLHDALWNLYRPAPLSVVIEEYQ